MVLNPKNKDENQVVYFRTDLSQITFEFLFLIFVFLFTCIGVFIIHGDYFVTFTNNTKWYLYSFCGGLLGGWTNDVKWFYRVIGRGKKINILGYIKKVNFTGGFLYHLYRQ